VKLKKKSAAVTARSKRQKLGNRKSRKQNRRATRNL